MKIILSAEQKRQIGEILAPLKDPVLWKSMELSFAPHPYAIVRMEGEPGTGKTALANYMARRMEKPPIHADFAGVASPILGDTEKRILDVFQKANETETPTIIMEECESLVWSRDMVNEDTVYHMSFVDTLLREIDKFIARPFPSLLILTTNYPQKLDAAIESRITDVIKLSSPVGEAAKKLWLSKLPINLAKSIQDGQLNPLIKLGATPRQMEQAVLRIARKAAYEKRLPIFSDFELPI